MQCLAAVDKNWAIALKGRPLVEIPADMKFLRNETAGKVIVMSRKTLDSFPGGRPMSGRVNICLCDKRAFKNDDSAIRNGLLIPVYSIDELLVKISEYNTDNVYVIGDAHLQKQLLPYCNVAHITKIDKAYEADTWFTDLDKDECWKVTAESDEETYFSLDYKCLKYERI